MILHYLADAGGQTSDLATILPWVTTFVLGVIGAVMGPKLKKQWKEEALKEAHVTIRTPVPTIHTKEEVELVTQDELNGHLIRIESNFREIQKALAKERDIARQAQSNVHARLDKMMENQAESRGELNQINLNVQRLLDHTK